MNFQVGDKVIYPNHGIGVVESIQMRPTAAGKIPLYELRILANDSRVWVPQSNANGVGLRPVVSSSEVRQIFVVLGESSIDQHSNWKGRFKENSEKMRGGSLIEVAVVLKGLAYLARKKALSFREKRMLERAKFLIISEIAEAEGAPVEHVQERVDRTLDQAFSGDVKLVTRRVPPKSLANAGNPNA